MQLRLLILSLHIILLSSFGCNIDWGALIDDPQPTAPTFPKPPTQPVKPQVNPARPVTGEFVVRRDGFSFPNYTKEQKAYGLTPANLERLCGPKTCARGRGNTCVPNGAMQSFLYAANRSMGGGHCEGMSVLAQAIYAGRIPLRSIDRYAKTTYSVPFENAAVQTEIAYWYSTQLTWPGYLEPKLTPVQVLKQLDTRNELYSIGICKYGNRHCHALTPVKTIRENAQISWIQVYDSNYPGDQRRFIKVNTATNMWYYDDYVGNAQSLTLTIRAFSNRIKQQQCPTDGDNDSDSEEFDDDDDEDWEVWLNGNGELAVPPGTKSFIRTSGLPERSLSPIYVFASGNEVKLQIVGKNLLGHESTDLSIFSQGQAFSVEGIQLDPRETDRVIIGKNGDSIRYSTKDEESVSVRLGLTYKGADYQLKIRPSEKTGGFDIFVQNRVDKNKGQHHLILRIKSHKSTLSSFTTEISRIDDKGDNKFTHLRENLPIGPHETVTIEYGKWLLDQQALSILRDTDSDGKTDKKDEVKDEN